METLYFRENEHITANELKNKFDINNYSNIKMKLLTKGILKRINKKIDDLEEDFDPFDEAGAVYYFDYVGIIKLEDKIVVCYPKYIKTNDKPIEEMKQILKVLLKHQMKENKSVETQSLYTYSEIDEMQDVDEFGLIRSLLDDYYENGLLTNEYATLENNGKGRVDWKRTISENKVFIKDCSPYYYEYKTRKTVNDSNDFIHSLHKWIITYSCELLESEGLHYLFDIPVVHLTDESIEDFGDIEFVLEMILKRLNVEFRTRDRFVLKEMYIFVNKCAKGLLKINEFLFGTRSFNIIWEHVCRDILDSKYKTKLCELPLPVGLDSSYEQYKNSNLSDLIEKPYWTYYDIHTSSFKLDLISISDSKFCIFDAKYYIPRNDKNGKKGFPEVESVVKEYMYQLAFKDFIKKHKFESVINCFLLPTEEPNVLCRGEVQLKMLENVEIENEKIKYLENIQVRFLPVKLVYNLYLRNKYLDINMLNL